MNRRELLAAGAFAAFAASMGAPVAANGKIKVGFIYVGPINDGGWTQHHHHSAMEMVEHFGGAVDFVYQENVPEGPDAERAITQMCLGVRTSSLQHLLVTWTQPSMLRRNSRM